MVIAMVVNIIHVCALFSLSFIRLDPFSLLVQLWLRMYVAIFCALKHSVEPSSRIAAHTIGHFFFNLIFLPFAVNVF